MKDAEAVYATLEQAAQEAEQAIISADSVDALELLTNTYFGKKSPFKTVNEAIKAFPVDERPGLGKALSAQRSRLQALLEQRSAVVAARSQASDGNQDGGSMHRVDLSLPPRGHARGHHHLVSQVQQELVDIFIGLGYTVAEGPEVESDWHNFEALNFPPGHPARDMQDTLYVERGSDNDVLLRTQTSPVQVRSMLQQPPPLYLVAPGRVFRQETLDARHSPVFHQIEGIAVDEGITMGDMFGVIEMFVSSFFGQKLKTRFQPSFFPFTEPSAEMAAGCVFCDGSGCRVCSNTGWIEIGGCGMVDPNVFEAVGVDAEKYTGWAFGFGIERMAMIRHDINDISAFYNNDIRFLKQF